MHSEKSLLKMFDDLAVKYEYRTHQPLFTCEQAHAVFPELKGTHCKNLFVKDATGRKWILVIPDDRRADLKSVAEKIGSLRLSFCSAEEMMECLGVSPGSVTPLAVINDADNKVGLIIDRSIMERETIICHPLTNTATVLIDMGDFQRFIGRLGHSMEIKTLV
jgi:Ala-tRNA(Pro) deacylase